jgi:hypothetical protein
MIKGLITLACGTATAPSAVAPSLVACPPIPGSYPGTSYPIAQCIGTPNDGLGNTVTLGVLRADGAGDPYAFYGTCWSGATAGAYRSKADVVTDAGLALDDLRSIDIFNCFGPGTNPAIPSTPPAQVTCTSIVAGTPPTFFQDALCIAGRDPNNNYVFAIIR